jgi:hypothetical protein
MSTVVKDMYNTTAVPTDNCSQGKCPLKEGLMIAFSIRLPGKLSSRHTVGIWLPDKHDPFSNV